MLRCAVWPRFPVAVAALATLLAGSVASSSADLIRRPTGPASVPHTQDAAIYDLFGLEPSSRRVIGTIQKHLSQEGYSVKLYRDSTEGAGGHGGATLANFVKMARTASVIVINTHGTDFSGNSQVCSVGKGVARLGKDGNADVVQICSKHKDEPVQQVEWYPTMEALHRAYTRYVTVGGFKKAWLYESPSDFMASTLVQARTGDFTRKKETAEGFRPWLGITTSGIKHFFSGHKIDLIDNQSCHSMAFASSFDALAYLGHANLACVQFEDTDEPLLFDRLTGHDDVRARSVVDAFDLGGFKDRYFRLAATQNVVLSPAVESASLAEGDTLAVGSPNQARVGFDAKMDTSDPTSVVKVTGCGAAVSGATWNGDGTELSYAINVPREAVGEPVTVTVHARAASGDGDNAALDGNQQPSGKGNGGVEPNGDDYVIHLACHARTFPVNVDYSGTYTDDYTNPTSHFTWHETLTWHESQTYRLWFADGPTSINPGPASLTASGALTTTGGSPDDNCTIAAIPGINTMFVSTSQVNLVNGSPTYVASFVAPMPTGTNSPQAPVSVTGTHDNCILDTRYGIAPYLFYNPVLNQFDPGGFLNNAWHGMLTNVDLGALVGAPLVVPFNVDYVENDLLGGSDHVVVKATAFVSLTGPPLGT